ncbi:hypothetical protein ACF059_29170 [Streptomyces sp. NPDC016562]|uniref:hypothetical protein n=1 Tax=Streptomyces sp. NPDC016562 TaxID=3364966 RepID=UPI0036FF4135
MVTRSVRQKFCEMLEEGAQGLREEIIRHEKNLETLREQIAELKRQPDPELRAIEALLQMKASLEAKLAVDQLSLQSTENAISELCP